jgi:glycosyltransferase involved in cell wall biosynthesis
MTHHLTMIGFREPGYLWRLSIPFVWGPVGGSSDEPLAFLSLFSLRGKMQVVVRKLCNYMHKRWLRRSRHAANRARIIWAATPADVQCANIIWHAPTTLLLESGATINSGMQPRAWDGNTTLRLVWSGLFFPRKALPILLHAIARLDPQERECVELHVLGEGSEQRNWQRLASQLTLQRHVVWEGFVKREKALEIMASCHVCVISSIKEAASVVTLEALSLGLPVVCHDACGMGLAINDGCGIKVPLLDPETSIQGFSQAIRMFLKQPKLVEELSRGALVRADELSWDKKAATIAAAYDQVIEGK